MIGNLKSQSSYFLNNIHINNVPIEFVSEYKYLGFIIDSELKFKKL